ncbi:hypothetical protein D9M71_718420 [compost metagenome]
MPGTHQVIGTGLGSRVGRTGRVRSALGEQIVRTFEIAIHLVGRNMVEAECSLGISFQTAPVATSRLQQGIGANHIGLDELGRSIDGAIYMRLGSQMHHRSRAELGKYRVQSRSIANIHLVKAVARRAVYIGQRILIASVS